MDIKGLRARKDDLWMNYGDTMPEAWPAEARAELEQINEALDADWDKRQARTQARKAKRLAGGGEWLDKTRKRG